MVNVCTVTLASGLIKNIDLEIYCESLEHFSEVRAYFLLHNVNVHPPSLPE